MNRLGPGDMDRSCASVLTSAISRVQGFHEANDLALFPFQLRGGNTDASIKNQLEWIPAVCIISTVNFNNKLDTGALQSCIRHKESDNG